MSGQIVAGAVLVTGASSGIGRATAHLFADEGWKVVATMRNPDDARELAEREEIVVARLDVTDLASIAEAVRVAEERSGHVEVLVNNAGYGTYGPFETMAPAVMRRQFDVNVFGLFDVTRAVLPGMRAQRSGTIINVSSVGGRMAYPLGTPYHATKWAVEGASEAMHYELLPLGIHVRIIEPGGVNTDFGGRSFVFDFDPDAEDYLPLVQMAQQALASDDGTATGTMEPADCAAVILEAATWDGPRLRFVAGWGAKQLLANRYDAAQDEAFVAGLRASFGL